MADLQSWHTIYHNQQHPDSRIAMRASTVSRSTFSRFSAVMGGMFRPRKPHVAVLRLQGTIRAGARGQQGISADQTLNMLHRAFKVGGGGKRTPAGAGKLKAVAIEINSGGGSAVQSAIIQRAMKRLSTHHDVPIYIFVEDVAASGGYMIACGAEEIIVDPSSVVGNVGVIRPSVGIHKLLDKWGIENQTRTMGARKEIGAITRPETPQEQQRLDSLLRQLHVEFKDIVKEARGKKIEESPLLRAFRAVGDGSGSRDSVDAAALEAVLAEQSKAGLSAEEAAGLRWATEMTHSPTEVDHVLEGDVFVGRQAVSSGFADGVGHLRPVMLEKLGVAKEEDARFVKVPAWGGWLGGGWAGVEGDISSQMGGGGCVLGSVTSAIAGLGESVGRGAVDAALVAAEEEEAARAGYGGRHRL